MVNCNPETVSTDYDTSDRLYFEPLTLSDVLAIVEVEQPEGVIVSFGGQTPLRLAAGLEAAGVTLLGTQPEAIDLAEDRGRFGALLERLGLKVPPYSLAASPEEALAAAPRVGFPVLVRPSYVLGGRSMELAYDEAMLADYFERVRPQGEIFLDRFLENAIEVDVDAICDGEDVWIGGIMQHVEEAGIHSGDSACVLPPHSLGADMLNEIRSATRDLALALGVVGLINIQYGVYGDDLYVIEANPRASRTVPFVSKATGLPLAKLACRVMLGEKLAAMGLPEDPCGNHVSVKEAVLPFDRFSGTDALLGPEMRSTGEVMGVAADFPTAFAKAQAAVGSRLPNSGTVFLTVTDSDKPAVMGIAAQLHDLGFRIVATRGSASAIKRMGIPVETINKIQDGANNVVDWIDRGDVDLVINTPTGTAARSDGYEIRRAAVARGVPCITTIAGGMAAARAIAAARVWAIRRCARCRNCTARGSEATTTSPPAVGQGRGRDAHARAARAPLDGGVRVSARRRLRHPRLRGPGRAGARPGPVLHAGRGRALGRRHRRAPVPAARVLVHAPRRRPARVHARGRRARHTRLGELRAGDGLWLAGPFGIGFAPPRDGRRPVLVGGGVGAAPLACWQDALGLAHARAARLQGRRARRGRLAAARRPRRHRRRFGRPPGPGHRPAAGRARA